MNKNVFKIIFTSYQKEGFRVDNDSETEMRPAGLYGVIDEFASHHDAVDVGSVDFVVTRFAKVFTISSLNDIWEGLRKGYLYKDSQRGILFNLKRLKRDYDAFYYIKGHYASQFHGIFDGLRMTTVCVWNDNEIIKIRKNILVR